MVTILIADDNIFTTDIILKLIIKIIILNY